MYIVNKNSENEFYKELTSVSKNWKVYLRLVGIANFTYQLELDGFSPNAIKIVKLIKSILVSMQSRS